MKSKKNKTTNQKDLDTFDPGKSNVTQESSARQVGLQVLLTVLKKLRKPK